MATFKKTVKRVIRRGAKALKRRYISKRKGLRFGRIAKDVMMLKKMVNAEKKHYGPLNFGDSLAFGYANGAGSANGGLLLDVSPSAMVRGSNRDQRTGNSVKVSTGCLRCYITGQSANTMGGHVSIELYHVKNDYYATMSWGSLGNDLFLPNPFTSIADIKSGRNPNYFKDFQLIRKVVKYLPVDVTNGGNKVLDFAIPLKFRNHHFRYDDSGSFVGGQIICVVRASTGNASSVTTATNTPFGLNTAVNTGFLLQMTTDWYYYDN